MFQWFKDLFEKAGGFVIPLKLAFGSLLGILIGPGLLGFLSELATYSFAIRHGVRPPLEGIPYLRAAVTFGGVFLTLAAAIVFFVAFRIAAGIAAQLARAINRVRKIEKLILPTNKSTYIFSSDDALALIRGLSIKWISIVSVIGALLSGAIAYFVAIRSGESAPHYVAIAVAVYFIVATFVLWKRQAIWWFAALVTVVAYVVAIAVMFDGRSHASFLRFVGYGGGLPVEIELHEPDADGHTSYHTHLVLRTTDALIVYDKAQNQIREFQLSDIRSVKYEAKPLHEMEYVLPPLNNSD